MEQIIEMVKKMKINEECIDFSLKEKNEKQKKKTYLRKAEWNKLNL